MTCMNIIIVRESVAIKGILHYIQLQSYVNGAARSLLCSCEIRSKGSVVCIATINGKQLELANYHHITRKESITIVSGVVKQFVLDHI